jgi:uncharacterized membrane protein YfcA
MSAITCALAVLVGFPLGLLGGGGSILAVPIFVYVLGFTPDLAIAMSLAVVGVTSLVGALAHWWTGHVNVRLALVFGSATMASTYLGSRLAVFLSSAAQMQLFALAMLAAALFMVTSHKNDAVADHAHGWSVPRSAAAALVVGGLTGLVGVGGGFLVVPALLALGRIPMNTAVGTSLLVIAMNSAAGVWGYLVRVDVPWVFTTEFMAVAVAGVVAGTYVVPFVPQVALKRAFAGVLVLVAAAVLYQNRELVLPRHNTPERSGMAFRK